MATSLLGGHGLARAAKATLTAQLPGVITVLNAQAGAPVTLVNPGSYYLYGQRFKPDLATVGVAVEVSSPDQEYTEVELEWRQADAEALVQVTVWAQDTDFPDLIESLERYATGVLSVMMAPDTCGAGTRPLSAAVRVRAADVDPDGAADQPVVAGAAILLGVSYDEVLDIS